jgi:hypothetical protein
LSSAGPRRTVGSVRDPITALESAIRSLPEPTRVAMLDGIRTNSIVCGAYTDGKGGICPMLAAHRSGGRVTLLAFARSWDGFTRAKRPRRATEREIRTLEHLLLASLEDRSELAQAIAEYQRTRGATTRDDRTPEDRGAGRRGAGRTFPDLRVERLSAPRRCDPQAAAGAVARTAS